MPIIRNDVPADSQKTIPASVYWLLFAALLALDVGLRIARYTQLEYQPRDIRSIFRQLKDICLK